MNDAFLPGNGFDTYEEQDRVLMGLSGSVRSGVAVRILQQQGFAVAAAVVRLMLGERLLYGPGRPVESWTILRQIPRSMKNRWQW